MALLQETQTTLVKLRFHKLSDVWGGGVWTHTTRASAKTHTFTEDAKSTKKQTQPPPTQNPPGLGLTP